jgi:hypothetical protein
MALYITAYNSFYPSSFSAEIVSELKTTSFTLGSIDLEKDSPFFPGRSDEKIMRNDVKMAIVAIRSMLNGMESEEIEGSSLFVANGAFVEDTSKYLERTLEIYRSTPKNMSLNQRLKDFYRVSPPLLALETLTNIAMSFIAQYVGLKGNNTTYGNTSISTFYCLQDALRDLENKKSQHAFVCATNCSGNYSFLMNSTISTSGDGWKESAGVACIALEYKNEPTENTICEISDLNLVKKVPYLSNQAIVHNWKSILPEDKSDLLIFSGAFHQQQYESDLKYLKSIHNNPHSLFEQYGNLGPANLLLGIIEGIRSFSSEIKIVDVVDRDVYGRESLVRIKAC